MADPQLKSLRSPDDVFRMDKIEEWSVQMGEQTIGRAVAQPGWRWSIDLKPTVGTSSCTFRHLGLVLTGRMHVRMDDGREFEAGPDDVFDIPPGHDAWVVGEEPLDSVEIAGIYGFGRPAAGESYVTNLLLTDIVDSTATMERIGAVQWRSLLDAHFEQARRALDRHHGVEVATTGDGILATFDSASRAVHAAADKHAGAERLGIRIRAGIHTGEVEPVAGNVRGMAVHVTARVAAVAASGETMVSSTTREMISGSDTTFEDRGTHELKGISGPRQLFAARTAGEGSVEPRR